MKRLPMAVRQHFSYEAGNLTASDNTPCTSEQDSVWTGSAYVCAGSEQSRPENQREPEWDRYQFPSGLCQMSETGNHPPVAERRKPALHGSCVKRTRLIMTLAASRIRRGCQDAISLFGPTTSSGIISHLPAHWCWYLFHHPPHRGMQSRLFGRMVKTIALHVTVRMEESPPSRPLLSVSPRA